MNSRYWVMYYPHDTPRAVYRLKDGSAFQRWSASTQSWVDASGRYERVTQDGETDEVSEDLALQIMELLRTPG